MLRVGLKLPPFVNEVIFNQMDQLQPQPSCQQPPRPSHWIQQLLKRCLSALWDGQSTIRAATGRCLRKLTGFRPWMGVNSFTQLHILLRLDRHQRMTTLETCTPPHLTIITSGWEDQILMRRETGPGLMGPHSTTQIGIAVRELVESQRTALLWTYPTDTGMIWAVLIHILIFVKSTLITNKDTNNSMFS